MKWRETDISGYSYEEVVNTLKIEGVGLKITWREENDE